MEAIALQQEALAREAASNTAALKHAIAAAEAFMKAVKETSSPAEKLRLKRKCEEAIALAERLKTAAAGPALLPTATPSSSTSSSSSPSSSGRGGNIIVPQPQPPVQSRKLPTSERTILLRSSRLHGNVFPPWESPPGSDAFRLSPSSSPDRSLYTDPAEFSLSRTQQAIFAGWKRPAEMFSHSHGAARLPSALMRPTTESDLVQDITTDCSVVASLCAAMKHLSSRRNPLLSTLMYPFDTARSMPLMSEKGKYVFRMHFNGCFRQVTIDDRLPSSKTSRTLFVVDRRNPQLIWPALMEKAYLKVRGGYDFPGSNSGTDLWVLTGWIPEQIFLHADDIELDPSWSRIKRAYDYGDVVVTLGTGRLSPEEEETLGLAGEHDYAVMDLVVDEKGVRRMLVKNPWCDGLVWKGVGSSAVLEPRTAPGTPRPGGESSALPEDLISSSLSPTAAAETMTGTFWIAFEDVLQNFESLYLNWNPSLFTHRQDHHFVWDIPDAMMANSFARNPQYSVCATDSDGAVWALLSRHFQDDELSIARNRSRESSSSLSPISSSSPPSSSPSASSASSASSPFSLGFMSLYLFGADGTRIQLPDRPRPLHRGHFVDSPQTLLRFEARRGQRYTLAVAQSALPLPRYSFSLSLFSRATLEVSRAAEPYGHVEAVRGSWTRRSAGGNASEPTYLSNPQYSIRVGRPTALSLLLCADNPDLPVHVDLVWAGPLPAASSPSSSTARPSPLVPSSAGAAAAAAAATTTGGGNHQHQPHHNHNHQTTPTSRDIVASSGEYRRGSALCEVSRSSPTATSAGGLPLLQPGMYTAVLSTFEPGQLAGYTLEVGSSFPVGIATAARTGAAAGRLRTPLGPLPDTAPPPRPSSSSAVAVPSSDKGRRSAGGGGGGGAPHHHHRPEPTTATMAAPEGTARVHRAPLHVSRLTRVSLHVVGPPRRGPLGVVAGRGGGGGGGGGGASGGGGVDGAGAGTGGGPTGAVRVSLVESPAAPHERRDGGGVMAVPRRRRVLAVSGAGEFCDAAVGARTGEVDVAPSASAALWVIVEQIGSSIDEDRSSAGGAGGGRSSRSKGNGSSTLVEVLSDNPVQVGAWEYVDD